MAIPGDYIVPSYSRAQFVQLSRARNAQDV